MDVAEDLSVKGTEMAHDKWVGSDFIVFED